MKFATSKWIVLALLVCVSSVTVAWAAGPEFKQGALGLRYKDLQLGQGPGAVTGQVATIHFVGWIDEQGVRGREVYNSRRQRGEPISFVIGTDGVMQGWNEGVLGMKPGGKRMLLVPAGLAWGDRAIEGVVPANTAMMFRLELISLQEPSS